jgi:hypothetical protein
MIPKVFLTTLILLGFYTYSLRFVPPSRMRAQNVWQENMVRMQDFVYGNNKAENIILGSSLSTRITVADENYCNLAAGGGNPFTGLEILKRSNSQAKTIFIEMNYLLTQGVEDDKYISCLFKPGLFILKGVVPILQERKQPASLAGYYLQSEVIDKVFSEDGKLKIDNTIAKRVAVFKKRSSDSVSIKPLVEKNLIRLAAYVSYFRSKGAELVFYEMPVDCSLTNDPQPTYCREKLSDFCMKYRIKELPRVLCSDYKTIDGNHLMAEDAVRYTNFFYKEIAKLKLVLSNDCTGRKNVIDKSEVYRLERTESL